MAQNRRQDAIEGFKNGSLKILVATDIAARGLDVLSITHVINYDMPDTTDAYTHRIGRTGRVDNTGEAYTLVTNEDRMMIKDLEKIFKKPIETRKIEGFNYDQADVERPQGSAPSRDNRGSRAPRRENASFVPRRTNIRNTVGEKAPEGSPAAGSGISNRRPSFQRSNTRPSGDKSTGAARTNRYPRRNNNGTAPSSVRFARPESVVHY
jgi:superfamily II DNA/RNA helicase